MIKDEVLEHHERQAAAKVAVIVGGIVLGILAAMVIWIVVASES